MGHHWSLRCPGTSSNTKGIHHPVTGDVARVSNNLEFIVTIASLSWPEPSSASSDTRPRSLRARGAAKESNLFKTKSVGIKRSELSSELTNVVSDFVNDRNVPGPWWLVVYELGLQSYFRSQHIVINQVTTSSRECYKAVWRVHRLAQTSAARAQHWLLILNHLTL